MKIKTDDLIKEFQEQYPEVPLDKLKVICKTPWKFLKKEMRSEEYCLIRFKYFGKFVVNKGRAKYLLKENERRVKEGLITKEVKLKAEKKLKQVLYEEDN